MRGGEWSFKTMGLYLLVLFFEFHGSCNLVQACVSRRLQFSQSCRRVLNFCKAKKVWTLKEKCQSCPFHSLAFSTHHPWHAHTKFLPISILMTISLLTQMAYRKHRINNFVVINMANQLLQSLEVLMNVPIYCTYTLNKS